jgi:hypothetical protein
LPKLQIREKAWLLFEHFVHQCNNTSMPGKKAFRVTNVTRFW